MAKKPEEKQTEVIPFERQKMMAALKHAPEDSGTVAHAFLRMGKAGEWTYGVQGAPLPTGVEFAVNPQGFQQGWICWGDASNKMGDVVGPMDKPLVDYPESTDISTSEHGWQKQLGCQLKVISGKLAGTELVYRANSYGGKRAIAELMQKVGTQMEAGDDFVAVVTLGSLTYKHLKYGKIANPVITVERWISYDELTAQAAPKKIAKQASGGYERGKRGR